MEATIAITGLVDWLLETAASGIGRLPFEWAALRSMRVALVAMMLLAPTCAMLGVFVVNMRMAFYSDAIAHTAFAGVAAGIVLIAAGVQQADPRLTLLAVGLGAGVLITHMKRRSELGPDTIVGVAFSAITALGIAVIAYQGTGAGRFKQQFEPYLYGDILVLDSGDLRAALLLAALVLVFLVLAYNRLLLISFNEDLARTRGVATRVYDYLLALLVALVVIAGIRLTGMLLITAMLVIPAAAARNLARNAGQVFWLALIIGFASGVGGLIGSYYVETVPSAATVLIGAVVFAVSVFVPRRLER